MINMKTFYLMLKLTRKCSFSKIEKLEKNHENLLEKLIVEFKSPSISPLKSSCFVKSHKYIPAEEASTHLCMIKIQCRYWLNNRFSNDEARLFVVRGKPTSWLVALSDTLGFFLTCGGDCKNLKIVFAYGCGVLNPLVIRQRLRLENAKLNNCFEHKKYLFISISEYQYFSKIIYNNCFTSEFFHLIDLSGDGTVVRLTPQLLVKIIRIWFIMKAFDQCI
jgi:hypothetical protein